MVTRLLFGTAQASSWERSDRRPWALPLAALGLIGVRLLLPWADTDAGVLYSEAAAALLRGDDWAKQALVGVVDYPTLPLLATAVAGGFAQLVGGVSTAAVLAFLVAAAQAVSLLYLWRAGRLLGPAWAAGIFALAAAAVLWWPTGFGTDPQWLMVVPGVVYLYHAMRLEKYGSLRDLALAGLCGGLMGLSGLGGLALALTGGLAVRFGSRQARDVAGSLFLLWMPVVYAVSLYPLANWLVMGDPFFFVKRLLAWQASTAAGLPAVLPLALLAMAIVLTAMLRGVGITPRLTVAWATGLVIVGWYANQTGLFLAEYSLLAALGGVAAIMAIAAANAGLARERNRVVAASAIAILALPAALSGIAANQERASFVDSDAPPPEEILSLIDRHWQDSRVLIYDLRTASLYAGHDSGRFVPNLDFNPYVFAEVTEREQMHLLVPPNDGRFYSGTHPLLSTAHAGDADRLFPEKIWPTGWQLWRCVRPLRPEALGEATAVEGGAAIDE